jgi:hypothetical protein
MRERVCVKVAGVRRFLLVGVRVELAEVVVASCVRNGMFVGTDAGHV